MWAKKNGAPAPARPRPRGLGFRIPCLAKKVAPPRRCARVLAGWDFAFHALRKKLRPRVGAPASSRAGISHSMPCEKSCAPASVRPRPRGLGFRIPCLAKKELRTCLRGLGFRIPCLSENTIHFLPSISFLPNPAREDAGAPLVPLNQLPAKPCPRGRGRTTCISACDQPSCSFFL